MGAWDVKNRKKLRLKVDNNHDNKIPTSNINDRNIVLSEDNLPINSLLHEYFDYKSAVELAQDLRSSRLPEIHHKPHGLDEEEFPN